VSAGLTVKAADSAADRKEFIEFPYRLHQGHPYWIPPLRSDVAHLLDPANPFFAHAEAQLFLARDASGTVVGRIAAVKNDAHTDRHHDGVGFFGFFESEKDPAVAKALFDTARDWLKAKGFTTMRGPMSPSINDEIGFLVDGFELAPVVMMPYTPAYYAELAEGYGLTKAKDVYAYRHDKTELSLDRVSRLAETLAKRNNIVVRSLDMKQFTSEVDKIKYLYNAAWEANWGAVQITDEELADVAKQLKPVVMPDLVQFAEVDGQTAGFALALPDLNVALKHMGGRLFPLGFVKLLWYQRKIPGLRVWALGVHPQYRRAGVAELMYLRIVKNGLARGMVYGESGWILEDNFLMRQAIEKLGGRRYKTYRVYDKAIGS
jgi:GNAT superfamily N-acetyltransferase